MAEAGGGSSTSEARPVALQQRLVGTGLLAEPRSPLPLPFDGGSFGRLILATYMPRFAFTCVRQPGVVLGGMC